MKIPSDNKWTQTNDGDIFGVLSETHNVNFQKNGVLKLSHKSVVHQSDIEADGGATDFEQVQGIEILSGSILAITDGRVFKGALDGTFFTGAGGADLTVSTESVISFDKLHVIDASGGNDNVDSYDGTTWVSDVITGLSGEVGVKHPMEVFDSLPTFKLAIGDKHSVRTYNSSYAANTTVLTLPEKYIVTTLAYRSGFLYIGTKTDNGDEARMFIWNGSGTNAQYSVPVGASWILSMVPYKNTVAAIANSGELFMVSGTAKQTLGFLPIFSEQHKQWFTAVASTNSVVLSAGMSVAGDKIFIAIEGDIANNQSSFGMKDGLWCYSPDVGVYSYGTPTVDPVVSDSGISNTDSTLTTSAIHNLINGDAVQFTAISGLSGVTVGVTYYAIVISESSIKIAPTRKDADLGESLNITGAVTSDVLIYAENSDRGSLHGGKTGAVFSTNHRTISEPIFSSDVVYGYESMNPSGTRESTLQGFTDSFNVGWFTTQKIYTENISQSWKKAYIKVNGAHLSNEEVLVKYRTEERSDLPTPEVSVTWGSATSFVTTDKRIGNNVKEDDEIMITSGQGQGQLAHITEITVGLNTVEVTIDESYGSDTATSNIVVTGYTKVKSITWDREHSDYVEASIDKKSSWIQIKVELRGFGIEVKEIELTNSINKGAN